MTAQCAPEAQTKPEATGNKPSPTVVADIDPEAVLSPGWFEEDRITTLKDQFASARPYTHVVLPELCSRSVLEKARNEIIENVVAKYKETDLFKVCSLAPACSCFSFRVEYKWNKHNLDCRCIRLETLPT